MNWKVIYLEKFEIYYTMYIEEKGGRKVGESSNAFDQLLIYWKNQVRNKIWLVDFFKLSSVSLSQVITSTMLLLQC